MALLVKLDTATAWATPDAVPVTLTICPANPVIASYFLPVRGRLTRDQERLAEVLQGVHRIAIAMHLWPQVRPVLRVL